MVKLELAASFLHAVGMELYFNDHVPALGRELVDIIKVWLPDPILDMPMKTRLNHTLVSAYQWLVDALLVPAPRRLRF